MAAKSIRKLVGMGVLSLIPGISLLNAAVTPRVSVEDLVSRSEIIAQAEVVKSWTSWDTEHKYIWTHYQMRVTDSIRGAASAVIVSEPGGTLDGISQAVGGVNAWNTGDQVIVFLHHVPNGYLRTTGGPQGNARISANGRVLFAASSGASSAVSGTDLRQLSGLSVPDVKARLRTAAQRFPLSRRLQ